MSLLEIKNLKKSFDKNEVLKDISLKVDKGEVLCIIGPSGSGKSTLLRCITGLETKDSGIIDFDGTFGLVFQDFNLFPHHSVMKNITNAPIKVQKRNKDDVYRDARNLLKKLDLSDKEDSYPCELSGGQQQRVAVARALASEPEIIFADEPTGNLDSKAGSEVLKFMRNAVDEHGQTIVMVTHDAYAAAYADRIIFLSDGKIVDEMREPTQANVLEKLKSLS